MTKRINRSDVDIFHDCGIYLPSRTVYMGTERFEEGDDEAGVDAFMAERIIKNLHILDSLSSEAITIIMNNIGGDVYHGLAIYDAIKACKSHIIIKALG